MKIAKKYFFISMFFVILLCGCITSTDDDGITEIQIKNMTNVVFANLRIREAGSTDWLIYQSGIFNEGNHNIVLSKTLDPSLRYDIQLSTADGLTATKQGVLVSQNGIIAFNSSDFDDDSAQVITSINILNETGVHFYSLLIGVSGSSSWLIDIESPFLNGGITSIHDISPSLSPTTLYDIQILEYPFGNITATKSNYILRQNGIIRFESSDLD